jgi:hypothetical protein
MMQLRVQAWKSIRQAGILSLAFAISALAAQAQVAFSPPLNISNNAGEFPDPADCRGFQGDHPCRLAGQQPGQQFRILQPV